MIKTGSEIKWKEGEGYGSGKVIETYDETISITIKSTQVTRNGEPGNKALNIKQKSGDKGLKLEPEVEKDSC